MAAFAAGLRPCLILLDLGLVGMSAAEFRRAQLSEPDLRDVPVVLFSGADDIAEHAVELSASAFLTKPVEMDQLEALIRAHCIK